LVGGIKMSKIIHASVVNAETKRIAIQKTVIQDEKRYNSTIKDWFIEAIERAKNEGEYSVLLMNGYKYIKLVERDFEPMGYKVHMMDCGTVFVEWD